MADFEAFFGEQYDPVVRSLTIVFGDRAAAEDAAQVGFEKALRRWRRVGDMDRPGTWVYVVALRHARHALGRAEHEPRPDAAEEATGPEPTVVSAMWIADVLAGLPARQRAVVVLRHLAGLRLAEIAEALGMSVGTVKSTLHAAHARLRVELAESDDETDEEVVPDAR